MRTRTIRWLTIVVAAALPLTTLGYLIWDETQPTSASSNITITAACRRAGRIARIDHAAGVERYKALRDAKEAAADDKAAQRRAQADRVCAVAALRDLQPATVSDRFYAATEDALSRFVEVFTDEPVNLGDPPSSQLVLGLAAGQLLLLCLALRQFALWRAERRAGPVEVGDISPPTDDQARTALAEIMRETLARAGVPPSAGAPGEVHAVVISALASADGTQGWLAQIVTALMNALNPVTGFSVTGKAFRNEGTKRCSVAIRASVTRTGAPFTVFTVEGDSYEDAAAEAAYQLYLDLADRDSVRTRTPRWLAWTSRSGLRSYDAGNHDDDGNQPDDALGKLRAAVNEEPSNVLVLILGAQILWERALGTVDEKILKGDSSAELVSTDSAIDSVKWALRGVHRAPRNDDALFVASVRLSYVEHWIAGWDAMTPEDRTELRGLSEAAVRKTRWWRRRWRFAAGEVTAAEAAARWSDVSLLLMRHTLANQRYWNVLWMWWRLASRRELVDRVMPWSRVRFNRRHAALGILDGIKWDRLRNGEGPTASWPLAYARWRIGSAIRRFRARVGNAIWRDPDHVVEWNLALAYACQVRMIEAITPPPAAGFSRPIKHSVTRSLDKSLLSTTSRLLSSDLNELTTTLDLATEDGTGLSGVVPYVADWARPLFVDTDSVRDARIWRQQLTVVTEFAAVATKVWNEREIETGPHGLGVVWQSVTGPSSAKTEEILEWFRADRVAWQRLAAWSLTPWDATLRKLVDGCRTELDLVVAGDDGSETTGGADDSPISTTPGAEDLRDLASRAAGFADESSVACAFIEARALGGSLSSADIHHQTSVAAARWSSFIRPPDVD